MSCPHACGTTSAKPSHCFVTSPHGSEQGSQSGSAENNGSRPRDPTKLVRIPDDINVIYAQPVRAHHKPYYDLKPSHLSRMVAALRALTNEAGGPTVEHGLVKAKELFKNGENPDLLRHALGIYLTHSHDAQSRNIIVPPLKGHASMLQFSASSGAPSAMNIIGGQVVTPDTQKGPAILAYWREDYDYNDHHIHWHTVFPGTGVVVDHQNVSVIDRQGELFLYMHSQMVARYETEGICWDLPLVRPWNQYDDVLEYGYVPMPGFITSYGGYPPFSSWYTTRNPHIPNAPDAPVPRAVLEKWRDNIYQAITNGYFWTKNLDTGHRRRYKLNEDNCANLVGVVIEAESRPLLKLRDGYTLDEGLYGNLHNFGHDKFAELSYHTYLTSTLQYGLMISNFGSPRDPAFWPWHKHVQYFGRLVAAKFPQDLTKHRAAVTLRNLKITPRIEDQNSRGGLTTFLGPPASNLMESLAKLDHDPYQWSVEVTSTLDALPTTEDPQIVTLRFFIAAKQLMEDYHNWIEMDKITVTLTSGGALLNVRTDKQSSVARKMGNYSELDPQFASAWCRCGWPQNMMLPVGKVEGMSFVAFCMATNDIVSEDTKASALSYCGALNHERKYPDPRGMGYPFNRVWTQHLEGGSGHAKLSSIIRDHASFPFIATSDFQIYRRTKPFLDSVLYPPPGPVSHVTWFNTIKGYFTGRDVNCMKYEYGYDLSNYEDVMLHSGAIYDATFNKRMPLQMHPHTQADPDPDHPMWTKEMCENFRSWMLNGCPMGEGPPPPPPATLSGHTRSAQGKQSTLKPLTTPATPPSKGKGKNMVSPPSTGSESGMKVDGDPAKSKGQAAKQKRYPIGPKKSKSSDEYNELSNDETPAGPPSSQVTVSTKERRASMPASAAGKRQLPARAGKSIAPFTRNPNPKKSTSKAAPPTPEGIRIEDSTEEDENDRDDAETFDNQEDEEAEAVSSDKDGKRASKDDAYFDNDSMSGHTPSAQGRQSTLTPLTTPATPPSKGKGKNAAVSPPSIGSPMKVGGALAKSKGQAAKPKQSPGGPKKKAKKRRAATPASSAAEKGQLPAQAGQSVASFTPDPNTKKPFKAIPTQVETLASTATAKSNANGGSKAAPKESTNIPNPAKYAPVVRTSSASKWKEVEAVSSDKDREITSDDDAYSDNDSFIAYEVDLDELEDNVQFSGEDAGNDEADVAAIFTEELVEREETTVVVSSKKNKKQSAASPRLVAVKQEINPVPEVKFTKKTGVMPVRDASAKSATKPSVTPAAKPSIEAESLLIFETNSLPLEDSVNDPQLQDDIFAQSGFYENHPLTFREDII